MIKRAKLSCWRKKTLSFSQVEKGTFNCWLFTVEAKNKTSVVQYDGLKDFSSENDGCDSAAKCGMELWPCRVTEAHEVKLLWSYPVVEVVYCSLGMACGILFGVTSIWRYLDGDEEMEWEEDDDLEDQNSSSIPFSFDKERTVEDLMHKKSTFREPPVAYQI